MVWKLNQAEPRYASVRYRCLMPLANLRALGIPSVVLGGGDALRDVREARCLIFVKTFSAHDLAMARAAHAAGVPILIDLCDNIFTDDYGGRRNAEIRANFRAMAALAAGVTTTGPALAALLRAHVPAALPVHVVPDQAETAAETRAALDRATWSDDPGGLRVAETVRRPDLRTRLRRQAARLVAASRDGRLWRGAPMRHRSRHALHRLAASRFALGAERAVRWGGYNLLPHRIRNTWFGRICRNPRAFAQGVARRLGRATAPPFTGRTVVWFGHHGSSHGRYGIVTLTDIADALAAVAREVPLRLLVVSDSREKFDRLIAPLPFPTAYRPWDPVGVFDAIRESDVCVLPNSCDAFSITKSANRAVMALSLGVPVVATRVPALAPLEGCLAFDDWEGGLRAYLTDPARRAADLARARIVIDAAFSGHAVAGRWAEILAEAGDGAAADPAARGAGVASG